MYYFLIGAAVFVILATGISLFVVYRLYECNQSFNDKSDRIRQSVKAIRSTTTTSGPLRVLAQPSFSFGSTFHAYELFTNKKIGLQIHVLKLRKGFDYPVHAHRGVAQTFIAKSGTSIIKVYRNKNDKIPTISKEIFCNGQNATMPVYGMTCFVGPGQYHTVGTNDDHSEIFLISTPPMELTKEEVT